MAIPSPLCKLESLIWSNIDKENLSISSAIMKTITVSLDTSVNKKQSDSSKQLCKADWAEILAIIQTVPSVIILGTVIGQSS